MKVRLEYLFNMLFSHIYIEVFKIIVMRLVETVHKYLRSFLMNTFNNY